MVDIATTEHQQRADSQILFDAKSGYYGCCFQPHNTPYIPSFFKTVNGKREIHQRRKRIYSTPATVLLNTPAQYVPFLLWHNEKVVLGRIVAIAGDSRGFWAWWGIDPSQQACFERSFSYVGNTGERVAYVSAGMHYDLEKDVSGLYCMVNLGVSELSLVDLSCVPQLASPPAVPTFPPFPKAHPLDPPPTLAPCPPPNVNTAAIPTNGNAVLIATSSQSWVTETFISKGAAPQWVENTPTGSPTLVAAKLDVAGTGAYLLEATTSSFSHTFDLTVDDGGFSLVSSGAVGVYTPGVGWEDSWADVSGSGYRGINLKITFPARVLTSVSVSYSKTDGVFDSNADWNGIWGGTAFNTPLYTAHVQDPLNNPMVASSINQSFSALSLQIFCSVKASATDGGGSVTIPSITVTGEGDDPFGGSSYLVAYAPAAFTPIPAWTNGAPLSGLLYDVYLTSTQGSLFVFDAAAALVYFSSDYGATWSAPITIGGSPDVGALGFDVLRIGATSLTGASGQVYKATALGGAYSAYGSALPAGAQPTAIVIPRYQFGSTTASNNTSTPQFLVASSVASSGAALWKVTASGVTFTNITPTISGFPGLAVHPAGVAMPWRSGSKIAAVLSFNNVLHLVTSVNAGAAWADRGVVSDNSILVRYRKSDSAMLQLFAALGNPKFSNNHGAALATKAYPSTSPILALDVYG